VASLQPLYPRPAPACTVWTLLPCVSQVVTLWFDMRVWESIVAILFGIPLAVICIQCTGETDTTPTGAVGKVCY
jgi:hypothetical protein